MSLIKSKAACWEFQRLSAQLQVSTDSAVGKGQFSTENGWFQYRWHAAITHPAKVMHPAIEFQLNMLFFMRAAPIAQPVEHLICNQGVGSSSLSGGTMFTTLMSLGIV